MSRPALLAAPLAAAALVLSACSTGSTQSGSAPAASTSSAEPGAFPVTVDHAFGATRIAAEPKRVVTLGWSDQDVVLALGVVPVGAVKITWGGNEQGSTPWFDAELEKVGADQPVRYDDADGVPFDDLAKLRPDLILATNSGLTQDDYTRLSKLAPTVAYPEVPWGTSWEDSAELVGEALGREQAADELVDRTEARLETVERENPALEDTSFVFATFDLKDTSQVGYYTPLDNRPQILEELGMENAPAVERLTQGSTEFWKTISSERAATLDSDVIAFYDETGRDEATIAAHPLLGQIPAIRSGARVALADKTDALTMSAPSPLAIPWFVETIVPSLVAAAEKSQQG